MEKGILTTMPATGGAFFRQVITENGVETVSGDLGPIEVPEGSTIEETIKNRAFSNIEIILDGVNIGFGNEPVDKSTEVDQA